MIAVLVVLGALPFVIGGIQNWYLLTYMDSILPIRLVPILFLLVWGSIAFLVKGNRQRARKVVIFLNLIAALDLLLLGVQELILHAYFLNIIGRYSQHFYLPIIWLGARLTRWSHSTFPAYVASFLLMVGASFIGCKLKGKLKK